MSWFGIWLVDQKKKPFTVFFFFVLVAINSRPAWATWWVSYIVQARRDLVWRNDPNKWKPKTDPPRSGCFICFWFCVFMVFWNVWTSGFFICFLCLFFFFFLIIYFVLLWFVYFCLMICLFLVLRWLLVF